MSTRARQKKSVRALLSLSLMFTVIATVPTINSAIAQADGTVTGRLWVDLDSDSIDDADLSVIAPFGEVDGFGLEPGAEGVNIRLLTEAGDEVATATSNADGSYAFPTQADGAYELEFEAPVGFDFSSTVPEADHSATSDPAPLPGFSQFARMPVTIDGADVVVGSVGLRPTAALDISWVDVDPEADGVQAIATGTEPFTSCADGVAAAGEDCSPNDNVVRTNDITSFTVSVSGDNIDPSLDPLPEVILEQHITPVDGAVIAFDVDSVLGVPPGCATEGVTKPSSVTVHPDGSSTLVCNIGDFDTAEVNFLTTNVIVSGDSPPGSSFTFAARGFAGLSNAVASPVLDAPAVIVSASPRFDLTMNRDESNTRNRVFEQAKLEEGINPITGEPELGKVFYYDVSLLAEGDGVGTSALGDEFSFTNVTDPILAQYGAALRSCSAGPFNEDGAASLPGNGQGAPYADDEVADNGTWTCTYNNDTRAIDVVVTGADTSAKHLPTKGADGTPLPELDVVLTGNIKVWYPLSAFMRTADPDWQLDDPIIPGSYPIYNCVGDFDPDSGLGAGSNYGDGFEPGYGEVDYDPEPTGNNCRFHNFQIAEPGSFFLRYGGNDRLDLGYDAELWPCVGDPDEGIVPRQTQCDSGDGPVAGGQNYYIEIAGRNQEGVLAVKDQWLCGVIDNSIATIRPVAGGSAEGSYGFAQYRSLAIGYEPADTSEWITEFARFTVSAGQTTWLVDHDVTGSIDANGLRTVDMGQMPAAAADCGQARTASGELEWTTDIVGAEWDPNSVVLVRTRPADETVELGAGEDLILYIPMQAHTVYHGDAGQPDAGEFVQPGAIVPVIGNYRAFGEFGVPGYDPNGHTGTGDEPTVRFGDRLVFEQVRLSVDMQAIRETSSPGDDDLVAVPAGSIVRWTVHPSVTDAAGEGVAVNVVVEAVLPEWAVFDASCTPAAPAGVGGPLVVPNEDTGETSLTWFFGDRGANVALPVLEVCAIADPFSPAPLDLVGNAEVDADNTSSGLDLRTDTRTVRVTQTGGVAVFKSVDQAYDFPGDDQIWSLRWGNLSQRVVVSPVDIIDVLPYNGDGVTALSGREFAESDYTGELVLAAVPAVPFVQSIGGGPATPDVGTWFVTGADPATVSHDPLAASNDLVANTAGWCDIDELIECGLNLTDVTAIRWVSERNLSPRTVVQADVVLVAGPGSTNAAGDQYVNRFTAYTETFPTLSVRSNEPWVQVVAFSLGDRIFGDTNNNGTFDEGIDLNIGAGVKVELYDRFDQFVAATETDEDGRWLFTELDPGSYYVVIPDDVFASGSLEGWSPADAGFHADPNADDDDDVDHHALADPRRPGAVRSSGLIVLSAQRDSAGLIIGDEPMGDGTGLEDPTSRDDLTNMGLDLALTPRIEIDIEAAINAEDRLDPSTNEDADEAPGRRVAADTDQRFSYLVSNPGMIGLIDVAVADDNGTPTSSDDWEAEPVIREGTNLGDRDRDGVLDPGETWLFVPPASADVRPSAGAYVNTAITKARPESGGDAAVTDSDLTAYTAVAPASINIEMATIPAVPAAPTALEDADRAPGRTVLEGTEIWWSYIVETKDEAGLTDVVVVDDSGTSSERDDFKAEPVANDDGINVGDLDRDRVLDAGERWLFVSPDEQRIKAEGLYAGTATVFAQSASIVDAEGSIVAGPQVSDTDSSHHNAGSAGIGLESYLVGTQVETPQDADDAPGPEFTAGVEVGWRYVVTNPGNMPLADVTVVSDNGTPDDGTDDVTMSGAPTTGDSDRDGLLDPGEQWVYGRSGTPEESGEFAEQARVKARAVVTIAIGSQPVPTPTDSDATNFTIAEPEAPKGDITVVKDVCISTKNKECEVDNDAHWTQSVTRASGEKALWRITVTNTGETDLRQVRITDDEVRSCSRVVNHLEQGDSESWRCVSGNVKESLVNTVVVNALPECEAEDFFGVGNFNGNDGPAIADRPGNNRDEVADVEQKSETPVIEGVDAEAIEAQAKPYSEREPVKITSVVMTHGGDTITQTSSQSRVLNRDAQPVEMVSITIDDNGIEMTLDASEVVGADVSNIQFPDGLRGVRTLENGDRTEVGSAGFETAVERVLTSTDIRDYLAYDGLSPKATNWAEDFDFVFEQPMRNDDYMIVFERNGNTFFELTPLDADGNKIADAAPVKFDKPYAWNTGYSPSDLGSQPMWFTVVDIEAFGVDTSETPIWGFQINNDGQADVKFFTFEGDLVDDDDEDEGIGDDDDIDLDPGDDDDDDDDNGACDPVRATDTAEVVVSGTALPGGNGNGAGLAFIDNGNGNGNGNNGNGNGNGNNGNGNGNGSGSLPSPTNPAAVAGGAAVACAGAAAAAAGGGSGAASSGANGVRRVGRECVRGGRRAADACRRGGQRCVRACGENGQRAAEACRKGGERCVRACRQGGERVVRTSARVAKSCMKFFR